MNGVNKLVALEYDAIELQSRTDEELVKIAEKDNCAVDVLISRYTKLIFTKANSYTDTAIDSEDLAQEGIIALLSAISKFDMNKNVKFSTFAEVCINNKMKTALVRNNRKETLIEEIKISENKVVSESPESILLQKERLKDLYSEMISLLSKREWEIFKFFLNGASYEKIAQQLAISPKSVDNAMQRVRRKMKAVWHADHFMKT
jgi:RNA polymerase sporulation-specific sigma factor